jgi:deoxyribodipyrimidine photo-lyase
VNRLPATVAWFRQDLRLADNPALDAAVQRGGTVIPVYIDSSEEEAPWAPGGAARWWLHQSLASLDASLRSRGSRLVLRQGPALAQLLALCRESGADAVYWNRRYEPAVSARDTLVKQGLRAAGLVAESRNGALLAEPWDISTQSGGPFQVFTPFWRRLLAQLHPAAALMAPLALPAPTAWPSSLALPALALLPDIPWYAGMAQAWQPGEAGATQRLAEFLAGALPRYAEQRDWPGVAGTSRLSAHLHHGESSPRQVWHAVLRAAGSEVAATRSGKYLAELVWREFSHHLLHHFPHTPTTPLRAQFARFDWRDDPQALRAWQRGRTGIPLVDAGMRELWATGWMHNRVRMIVASFLVKNLRLPWQAGARWFWDTLVDADLASNTQGWQWSAGCGADAAPYFRVFNPVTQGRRFDPQGQYLRRWLPELARLTDEQIHAPWEVDAAQLSAAGVVLGAHYPAPIVDLRASRAAALAAYQQMRA